MALDVVANYDDYNSSDERDLYTAMLDMDGSSIDVWVPKGTKLTSMDIHIEFEEE